MKRLSERVAAFLAGEGERVVRRQLDRHRLPRELFDDIVEGVLWRVLHVERNDRAFEPDNLEAWVSRLVQREARDVLRGRLRRRARESPVFEGPENEDTLWDHQADEGLTPDQEVEFETVDLVLSDEQVAAVRGRLAGVLASKPYPAAAALCMVTMFCDGAEPADDVPRPQGGVGQDQAPWWAAVFYSGRTNCFAVNGLEEDPAMRKRRSRAMKEARAILEDATHG